MENVELVVFFQNLSLNIHICEFSKKFKAASASQKHFKKVLNDALAIKSSSSSKKQIVQTNKTGAKKVVSRDWEFDFGVLS